MTEAQALKQACRKSHTEGPQYVVWVFDQGRDIFNADQMRTYAPLVHVEHVCIGGVDIPQEVVA